MNNYTIYKWRHSNHILVYSNIERKIIIYGSPKEYIRGSTPWQTYADFHALQRAHIRDSKWVPVYETDTQIQLITDFPFILDISSNDDNAPENVINEICAMQPLEKKE